MQSNWADYERRAGLEGHHQFIGGYSDVEKFTQEHNNKAYFISAVMDSELFKINCLNNFNL